MGERQFKGPLHRMVETTRTALWNDSCSLEELRYSIDNGAVGATANPVIIGQILKKEMGYWQPRLREMIRDMPDASEDDIAWKLTEEMSRRGAALLLPIFQGDPRGNGRLSIQTDPRLYRNAGAIVEQAARFDKLAPNIIVKIPATSAGIDAVEEATRRGISVNATVCFTVSQCIAVAQAMERSFRELESKGVDVSRFGSVCTIMVGRLDDWLKIVREKQDLVTEPGTLEWAGVAVMKKTYRIFKDRGYRVRLLSAAFRNHLHWSEFIGGDVVISPPYRWQKRYNASDVEVAERMQRPVEEKIVAELRAKFADFRRAYEEDGLSRDEFDSFGPTVRTLRQFIDAYHGVVETVRNLMLPNPDA
jgi:transaldolase